jgi:uncharacterized protein with GYD domain
VPTAGVAVAFYAGCCFLISTPPDQPISIRSKRGVPICFLALLLFNQILDNGEEIAMHFCLTGQYTPRALNAIMENPTTNRQEAARKLIEAGGGKLISMFSTQADGPGVLTIIDVPDPSIAPAIVGVIVAAGTLHNVKLTRLLTQDEVMQIRQKAGKLRSAYSPPGS